MILFLLTVPSEGMLPMISSLLYEFFRPRSNYEMDYFSDNLFIRGILLNLRQLFFKHFELRLIGLGSLCYSLIEDLEFIFECLLLESLILINLVLHVREFLRQLANFSS